MRKRFNQQLELGVTPISEVSINLKSRHELPPLLYGLQEIFVTPEINEKIFKILESRLKSNIKTGRPGMDLWEIFVLGMVRLNINIDYDHLCDLANEHHSLRGILGVLGLGKIKKYHEQTIKDNIEIFDEPTLKLVNEIIVQHCIRIKKKEGAVISLSSKVDSFVVESNIHFPTDLNLLKDSVLCSIQKIKKIKHLLVSNDWRLNRDWRNKVKKMYRNCSEIHRKKGANYEERLGRKVELYIGVCQKVLSKIAESYKILSQLDRKNLKVTEQNDLHKLEWYILMQVKHIDLVERRILKGEKIPHEEKLFSIHEPHVEWINKGKYPKQVELGHNVNIVSNQDQWILDWKVYGKTTDVQQTIPIAEELIKKYSAADTLFASISFDKGYYSKLAKEYLVNKFETVVLPKKGKLSKEQKVEMQEPAYKKYKSQHSTVEANISHLHKFGLDKCPDKGINNFKRYIGMAVLSYNITKWGRMIMENKKAKLNKINKKRLSKQAA